jgi:uncharacterized Zn-binding protein involved in type VI secretion
MGQPAAKQGDQITATHIHTVTMPGAPPTSVSLTFPFSGIINSGCSADVNIEGKPAATQNSVAANSPPHIPAGGFFTPQPSDSAQIQSGSTSVSINGKPAARSGDAAMACDLPGAQVVAPPGSVSIG